MKIKHSEQLTTVELSKELARTVLERTRPFIYKYTREQEIAFNSPDYNSKYSLKHLVCSAYLQGLSDAKQVINHST